MSIFLTSKEDIDLAFHCYFNGDIESMKQMLSYINKDLSVTYIYCVNRNNIILNKSCIFNSCILSIDRIENVPVIFLGFDEYINKVIIALSDKNIKFKNCPLSKEQLECLYAKNYDLISTIFK